MSMATKSASNFLLTAITTHVGANQKMNKWGIPIILTRDPHRLVGKVIVVRTLQPTKVALFKWAGFGFLRVKGRNKLAIDCHKKLIGERPC